MASAAGVPSLRAIDGGSAARRARVRSEKKVRSTGALTSVSRQPDDDDMYAEGVDRYGYRVLPPERQRSFHNDGYRPSFSDGSRWQTMNEHLAELEKERELQEEKERCSKAEFELRLAQEQMAELRLELEKAKQEVHKFRKQRAREDAELLKRTLSRRSSGEETRPPK